MRRQNRPVGALIVLIVALTAMAEAQESQNQVWANYDESGDLARLAELDDARMHYQLLRSGMQTPGSLWASLNDEINGLAPARYRALEPLVVESSIAELQEMIDAGNLSYEELTLFYLSRIRETEGDPARYLNAVVSLNPASVERARALDLARRAAPDTARDPIYGMPILLKDNINAAGVATTAGAVALQNNFADDAFIVEKLLDKGAVILGKANLSEWAYFFCDDCPSGWSAMGGQTLNPYGRLRFNTGGSSSGSGASIAANYAAAAVGSETSGSILSPSSANSLVGLKPTTGSLSRTGVVPISGSLDTTGPMARSVADVIILFNGMTGYDQRDTAMPMMSDDLQLEYRDQSMAGLRLGAPERYLDNELFLKALRLLSADEAAIVEISLPEIDTQGFGTLLGREMVRDLALYLKDHASPMVMIDSVDDLHGFNLQRPDLRMPYGQAEVDRMIELDIGPAELETLRDSLQSGARAAMEALFAGSDLDLMLSMDNRNAAFAALANYPALTVPLGYSDSGRPVNLTLFAPPFQEQLL
ncbi:MAG: amidase family protein, partial [Pseudomonadota bacterium]|nr:amidase family protein [Pseudomonadota bacterium]